jgi:hypothetical protein
MNASALAGEMHAPINPSPVAFCAACQALEFSISDLLA